MLLRHNLKTTIMSAHKLVYLGIKYKGKKRRQEIMRSAAKSSEPKVNRNTALIKGWRRRDSELGRVVRWSRRTQSKVNGWTIHGDVLECHRRIIIHHDDTRTYPLNIETLFVSKNLSSPDSLSQTSLSATLRAS